MILDKKEIQIVVGNVLNEFTAQGKGKVMIIWVDKYHAILMIISQSQEVLSRPIMRELVDEINKNYPLQSNSDFTYVANGKRFSFISLVFK